MLSSRSLGISLFAILAITAAVIVYFLEKSSHVIDTGAAIHNPVQQQKTTIYVPPKTLDDKLRVFVNRNATMNERIPDDFSSRIFSIDSPHDIAAVVSLLNDTDDEDAARNVAAGLLARSKYSGLVETLNNIIDNPKEKPRFRTFAAQYLAGQLSSNDLAVRERVNAKLHQLLADRDIEVRREAVLALVHEKDPQAMQMAVEWLNNSSEEMSGVKDLAIHCVYEMNQRSQISVVRTYLQSKDETVRIAAICALSQWYDDESRAAFEEAAQSNTVRVQRAGREAMARLDSLERLLPRSEQTIEKLAAMLTHDRLTIRNQAAMALAPYGADITPAIPSLTAALKRLDSSCTTAQIVAYLDPLRKAGLLANGAAETIIQLMDERALVFKERRKPEVHRLRAYMLLTLADIGAARISIKYVVESLANSDKEMGFNFAVAAHAAGTLGAEAYELTPLLVRALKVDFADTPMTLESYFAPLTPTTTTSGRIEAIRALAKIGPRANDAIPLLEALTATNPESKSKIPSWKTEAQKALLAIKAVAIQK